MEAQNSMLAFRKWKPLYESEYKYPGARSKSHLNQIPPERALKFNKTDSIYIPLDGAGFRTPVGLNGNTGHVGQISLDNLISTRDTELLRVHGEYKSENFASLSEKHQASAQNYFPFLPSNNSSRELDPTACEWAYQHGDPFFIAGEVSLDEGERKMNVWNLRSGELLEVPLSCVRLFPSHRYDSPFPSQEPGRKTKEKTKKIFHADAPLVLVTALGKRHIRKNVGAKHAVYCIDANNAKADWVPENLVVELSEYEINICDTRPALEMNTTTISYSALTPNYNLDGIAELQSQNSQNSRRFRLVETVEPSNSASRTHHRGSRSRETSHILDEDAPGEVDEDYTFDITAPMSSVSLSSEEEDRTSEYRSSVVSPKSSGHPPARQIKKRVNYKDVMELEGAIRYGSMQRNTPRDRSASTTASNHQNISERSPSHQYPASPGFMPDDNIELPGAGYFGFVEDQLQEEKRRKAALSLIANHPMARRIRQAEREELERSEKDHRQDMASIASGLDTDDSLSIYDPPLYGASSSEVYRSPGQQDQYGYSHSNQFR